MGANLVPAVRNFYITHESFDAQHGDVLDGCVQPNQQYKLLRFDFLSKNIGDHEFNLGRPVDRPDLFEYSKSHGHYHMKQFNQYILIDSTGTIVVPSKKPGFCTIDVKQIRPNAAPRKFVSCASTSEMGISAGWADVYGAFLGCQYIIIDGVPDGLYTLVCTTNSAHAADKDGVPEDSYCDNTISVNLEIVGDTVFEVPWWSRIHLVELAHALDPGWLLELWLAIHGGDPGPESKRLKHAEEHLEAASTILRELDESARLSGVGVGQSR
jgi:hypothetical protein